ncbi:hypothetical protein BJ741DRAFT_612246 [Chytriomyces cf. hyalinus JEL632]|nr:hypothetical protein BJ741DRAFT_612246 [Chytriomyces cf. hyalinus JEL632]
MATQLTCSVEEVALAEDGGDTELQVVRRLVLHLEFDVANGQITTTAAPQPPPRNNTSNNEQPPFTQTPSTTTSEWTILRGKPLSVHASVSLDPRVFQVGMRFYRAESEEDKLQIIGFGVLSLDQLVSRMQDIVTTAASNYTSISHPPQQQPDNDNNRNPNDNTKDTTTPTEYLAHLQDLESDTEMIQLLFTAIKQNQNLETKLRAAEKQRVETLQKLSLMQKRLEKETERVVKCSEKVFTL